MKRKIIILIAVISICLLIIIGCFSTKIGDCKVSANGENIEYYSECFGVFSSPKKYLNDAANAENEIKNVICIGNKDEIKLEFDRRPVAVLQIEIGDTGAEFSKIKYNSNEGAYLFNPLYDNDECWVSVVADYRIKKKVITFCVYNKDYAIDDKKDDVKYLSNSKVLDNSVSQSVLIKIDYDNLPINSSLYSFDVINNGSENITLADFIIEKKINGKWYTVEEKMNSFVAQNGYESIKLLDEILPKGEKKSVKLNTSLFLLFDDGISVNDGGEYRFVVPYSSESKIFYAVSESFTSGYVSDN